MIIIGVTGGFATGKTTVANFFAELGAKVIDADKIAHNITRRNSPVFREIVASFGKDILSKNKSIDRRKLASLVFGDREALRKLCRITHPSIIDKIKEKLAAIEETDPQSIVVIGAPLLIETNLNKIVDWLVVVDATADKQRQRAIARRKFNHCEVNPVRNCDIAGSEEDISNGVNKRIKAQLPLANKKKLADCVIDNNGTLQETKKQVKKIWRKLRVQI